jgi:phage terminase large subunit-like protein
MLEPITDDMKIVRRVRLVDIEDPRVQEMLRTAENRMSVDPASKGDGTGDKAGLVVMAIGDIVSAEKRDGISYMDRETIGLVRLAKEFDATQTEIMNEMRDVSRRININMAYVEVVGGYGSAIIEALQNFHGVHSTIGLKPDGNKAARFKAVAGMLENADPLIPATIAFPAKYPRDAQGNIPDGARLEPIEGMDKLISYVENFAVEEGYHSLDALTQMAKMALPVLGAGRGAFSAEVQQEMRPGVSANKVRKYREAQARSHAPSRRRGLRMEHTPV